MNQIDLRAMNLCTTEVYIRVRVVYNFIKIVLRLTDIDCEKSIEQKKKKQHHTPQNAKQLNNRNLFIKKIKIFTTYITPVCL